MIVSENDEVCGYVSWHWNHWGPTSESRCPILGIWLRESWRGRGVGRLAQRRVAEILFEQTPTNRVEAHTDVENVAEWRALEAAGFTREGIIRGAHWRTDGYHDGYLYSILRGELRAPVEASVAPAARLINGCVEAPLQVAATASWAWTRDLPRARLARRPARRALSAHECRATGAPTLPVADRRQFESG